MEWLDDRDKVKKIREEVLGLNFKIMGFEVQHPLSRSLKARAIKIKRKITSVGKRSDHNVKLKIHRYTRNCKGFP